MANEFSFINVLLTDVVHWGVPIAGGFIAVFLTPLLEGIKLRLNRADLRTKQFEEFSTDLSNLMFLAELIDEFAKKGWTTPDAFGPIATDYNIAITTIRKKEFVYLSWAHRYWKKSDLPLFEAIFLTVKEVDVAVHLFNDGEFTRERVESLQKKTDKLRCVAMRLLMPSALAK